MTPLIITPEVEAEAKRIRVFADEMENRRTGPTIPGDSADHSMIVPIGFKVVYSVDAGHMLEGDLVWFKHLSVSVVATAGRTTPSRAAMRMLSDLFGFTEAATFGTLSPDPDSVIHALEQLAEADS